MTNDVRMSSEEAGAFLTDRTLQAIDPDTGQVVGQVTYSSNGTCLAEMVSGENSPGVWGLTDAGYWTQYETFRDGKRHAFTLVRVNDEAAQAYFDDGRRAFLQQPRPPER